MDAAVNATSTMTSALATNSSANITIDFSYRVRAYFYALTMEETFIADPNSVPNIVIETLPILLLMTFFEMILLIAQGRRQSFRLYNAAINYASGGITEAINMFTFRGAELTMYVWVHKNLRLIDIPWDSPWTYFFAIVGVDFCNYWWHRLSHELSFMWAAHYVHHSSEDFNASVGARISVTMRPFKWIYFIPLAMIGLPPSSFLVHSQLGLVWAFWVHCEVWPKTHKIIPVLGHIFEFFMSTPSHHRVHHAVNKYCIDKNYGTTLIIWDRLFGTFVEEREDEPLTYGTISQKDNKHIIGLQADPWRDLWSRIGSVDSIWDKLRTIVYGPGWTVGKPRLGDFDEIPDVTGRKKHSFVAPMWLSYYLALHSFIVLVFYIDVGQRVLVISQSIQLLALCYIFLAYGALGGLYSAHQGSMWLEPLRLLASVPILLLLPVFHSERFTMAVITINLLSLLAWPAIRREVLSPGKKTE